MTERASLVRCWGLRVSTSDLPLEVSCQLLGPVFEICDELGGDRERLVRDLPYSLEHLLDRRRWIDWCSFARLMHRLVREQGATQERVAAISAESIERALPRLLLAMVGLFASPIAATRWFFDASGVVHKYCRVFETCFIEHPDGRGCEWTVELRDPSYELTEVNFWGIQGQAQAIYRKLGARDAVVEMSRLERGYRFEVRFERRGLGMRVRELLARPLRARRARTMLSQTNDELLERLRQLEAEVRQRERVEEELRQQMAEAEALQRQLARSERLNTLGLVAGGLAHDFNNLLVAIMGHTGMLRLAAQELSASASEDLDGLDEAATRAAELTRQLLTLGRHQNVELTRLELGAELCRSWKLLGRLLPSSIDKQLAIEAEDLTVVADRGQLEQLVMNLCLNARDAMPAGGRLELGLDSVELSADELADEPELEAGTFARIWVQDTGEGIASEDLDRIFEPFFTTKAEGLGTGLGLSVVVGVVRRHGGLMRVESQRGEGTRFEIYLPQSEAGGQVEAPGAGRGPAPGGCERILVVDDHDLVRQVIAELLRGAGYEVVVAEDGEQALARLSGDDGLALVLSDIVMPRRSGIQLGRALRRTCPEVALVLLTGYPSRREQLEELLAGGAALLRKPFTRDQLLWAVRDALDGRRPPTSGGVAG